MEDGEKSKKGKKARFDSQVYEQKKQNYWKGLELLCAEKRHLEGQVWFCDITPKDSVSFQGCTHVDRGSCV